MLKSHENFYSKNGKRLVLIVTQDPQEQRFFDEILHDEYLLLFAESEEVAEEDIRENGDVLSLVILHLTDPPKAALKLLDMIRREPELQHIPAIVADEDRDMEIAALEKGAIDVIVMPYPTQEIIRARVRRTIELSEDRAIISSTERDSLTGLYNREYFYRYAEQYDHHHKGKEMDAIVIDVNNFRVINERFGTAYGDALLRRIGERVRDMVKDSGGIVCRREADTFQVYCPHGKSYQAILDNASIGLLGDDNFSDRIRLRMGVYEKVDKTLAIERRFDRANMAADTVRSNFARPIAIYDSALNEKELEDVHLVEEFHQALNERQFYVAYQPKFDVRGETPLLASAEALARWKHPVLGEISPGRFIPLFEENGLIQLLDHYIWNEVARQIREWKDRMGFAVPISVNVSRVNMYDPNMVTFLLSTLKKYDLSHTDIYLEITESAYTQDSDQIIHKVELLRDIGFRIEMDDFGTGYSSLNMISRMPIDVLKLDREFIQMAFREGGQNTRMMEIMLDIAEYLQVPVVAEGVETEAQMNALKDMGCEVIQGYYFSRPVPPQEFEKELRHRKAQGEMIPVNATHRFSTVQRLATTPQEAKLREVAHALFRGCSRLFVVNSVTEHYIAYQPKEEGQGLRVEKEGDSFFDFPKRKLFQYLHPEDRKLFLKTFSKDNLSKMLARQGAFSGVFRLMLGEEAAILHVQAASMGTAKQRQFLLGISNVDVRYDVSQGLRESVRTIGKDALTSTKNINSYLQEEGRINEAITCGEMEPFALALIDMDGYARLCETLGQKAGDQAVLEMSSIVCDIYSHSPVYRIGDDEFIVLLMRRDFRDRQELQEELQKINEENVAAGGVSFSWGMSEFRPDEDKRLATVFERASQEMVQRRKAKWR